MNAVAAGRLNAPELATALRSGIHRVIRDQDDLNAINVFPVPDGDTGTNLSLSLGSVLPTLAGRQFDHVGRLLARVADELLDGSRGNSGAIVAQFFQGVSDAAEELPAFSMQTLARAVALGSEYAHDALSNPREGTILSVIAEFARSLQDSDGERFDAALATALEATRRALARTPDQLDALRKAGVVDAGARGFVDLLDGMVDYLVHGRMAEEPDLATLPDDQRLPGAEIVDEDLEFRFCTECVVTGTDIDRRKLREALSSLGNSLVLAGSKRKAKIHVHVNEPERVFAAAARHGAVSNQKADDMHRQQHSTRDTRRFAVITDSAADIPEHLVEALDIHIVPLRVQFGERGYLDKVSLSPDEFFEELASNPAHPTTSQPAPGDFRRQYQFLASHYPDVISISLTGKLSGTLQAAESAAARIRASGRVHVINTLNASLGQGLLAILAAECAEAGLDAATTIERLEQAIPQTTCFAIVRDLTYAVRGGRVPKSRKFIADLLRVTPVLRSRDDGSISSAGIIPGRRDPLRRFAKYIARFAPEASLRFLVGHAKVPQEAERLAGYIEAELPGSRCQGITPIGTALGVHAGPGALLVGIQPVPDDLPRESSRQGT